MAAIVLFTRTLARGVGQFGIRANCLRPVAVTEALQQGLTAQAERQGIALEEVARGIASGAAMGRMPSPEEAADAAMFLCSDASTAITSQMVSVNRGTIMR